MQTIPAIDVQRGVVVRGVGGRRREYRPLRSVLADRPTPAAVAKGLVEKLGLDLAYVADLDAIEGGEPAAGVYRDIAAAGMRLWVDAGVGDVERARQMLDIAAGLLQLEGIVVGLESLDSPERLVELAGVIPAERLIFSLDLRDGQPIATAAWDGWTPTAIAKHAIAQGVRRLIVLDLAHVGAARGVGTEALCRELSGLRAARGLSRFSRSENGTVPLQRGLRDRAGATTGLPSSADDGGEHRLELIAGGGVRNLDDIHTLQSAGCTAALVASALHDGALSRRVQR